MDFQFGEVTDLGGVPEQFRSFYNPDPVDGKYQVLDTFGGAASAILGLNKSLKAARLEARARNVDLTPLSEFGSTPEEIAEKVKNRIAELETALAQGDKAKLNVDKVRDELSKNHAAELGKTKEREAVLLGEIRRMTVTQSAIAAIVDLKGEPDLLMPFVTNQVQVVEEGGKFNVYVVDAAGDRRYSGATGAPMTIGELVKEMKSNPKFSRLFDAEQQSGGGGMPPGGGGSRIPRTQEKLTSVDRISRGLAGRNRR